MGFASGSCSLIIRGKSLDFDEINTKLGIVSTDAFKAGDVFSKVGGEIKEDVWIYKMKMEKTEEPNQNLERVLNILRHGKEALEHFKVLSDVCIRCYIQSELAQIGFSFNPEVIQNLAELKIRLEVSILSWGGVEE